MTEQMTANDSILYKEAVGTYEDFIASEQCQFAKTVMTPESITPDALQRLYNILMREFSIWEIAFTSAENFLCKLWTVIEVYYPIYVQQVDYYNQLLTLPDNELLRLGHTIFNIVENTNERYDDPLSAPLKNITSQQSTVQYADKIPRLKQAIAAIKMNLLNDFLKNFNWLFVRFTNMAVKYNCNPL